MLDPLWNSLMWGLESLGKPGRAARGVIGGLTDIAQGETPNWGGGVANLIPFSDTLGITDPEQAITGWDLAQNWNLYENQPGLDPTDIASFGIDIATDPLTWFGAPLAKAGAKVLGWGSKVAPAAKAVSPVVQGENAGALVPVAQRAAAPIAPIDPFAVMPKPAPAPAPLALPAPPPKTLGQVLPPRLRGIESKFPEVIKQKHGLRGVVKGEFGPLLDDEGARLDQVRKTIGWNPKVPIADQRADAAHEAIVSWIWNHGTPETYKEWHTIAYPKGRLDPDAWWSPDSSDIFARDVLAWIKGEMRSPKMTKFLDNMFGEAREQLPRSIPLPR